MSKVSFLCHLFGFSHDEDDIAEAGSLLLPEDGGFHFEALVILT